jgi:hypothetical protein
VPFVTSTDAAPAGWAGVRHLTSVTRVGRGHQSFEPRRFHMRSCRDCLVSIRLISRIDSRLVEILLFTAQPKSPAFVMAGAFGWVVND